MAGAKRVLREGQVLQEGPALEAYPRDLTRESFGDPGCLYLGAALAGATFNPWMILYQLSALAEKRLGATHYVAARGDTAAGAMLTQVLTAAVLIAAAATLGASGAHPSLESVGQTGEALTPMLGDTFGRLAFGLALSIPMLVYGSAVIRRFPVDRHRSFAAAGGRWRPAQLRGLATGAHETAPLLQSGKGRRPLLRGADAGIEGDGVERLLCVLQSPARCAAAPCADITCHAGPLVIWCAAGSLA